MPNLYARKIYVEPQRGNDIQTKGEIVVAQQQSVWSARKEMERRGTREVVVGEVDI